MTDDFVRIASRTEIPDGKSKLVHVEDTQVAVWRVKDDFYAINNVCPHQHVAALHQGTLSGTWITCPMHGWTFSLETGLPQSGDGRAKIYRVRVEGEEILIERPIGSW
jgi:NAD(P)H-dependent nitrite reductase small subunit